jgi:hypothetical protein
MAFWTVAGLVASSAQSVLCDEPPRPPLADKPLLSDRLVAEAKRMISQYKETRYSHKTYIDPERGICEVDCSGFLVAILKEVAPEHLRIIPTKHKRPLAEDFYNIFAAPDAETARGWRRVRRLADAEPGDIIAWLKLDREPGDNTGHVMLIAEKPVADPNGAYRVRILDSTKSPHGHDTRAEGTTGIGRGTIWLETDDRGRLVGYHWKLRDGKLHEVPIIIGRAVPFQK